MAKLVVDKASLVSVADAIREKGNTTDDLEFPNGFVDGINAIESGGGGGTEEFTGIKWLEVNENGYPISIDLSDSPTLDAVCHCPNYHIGVYSYIENVENWKKGANRIGVNAFTHCEHLKSIPDMSDINSLGDYCFDYCKVLPIQSMPPKLETIGSYAFRSCYAMASEIVFPPTLKSIGNNAFNGISVALKKIKFTSIPILAKSSFSGCKGITDIYVPWAEGTNVGGDAPWGATSATIHYNTTYDENGNPIDCSCEPETEGCPNAKS